MMHSSTAYLVSKEFPPAPPKTYPLNKCQMVMGRTLECDITLLSVNVSRHHAILELGPSDAWTIEDKKSLNGVFVNNQQLEKRAKHPLMNEDTISLGPPECSKHQFTFFQPFGNPNSIIPALGSNEAVAINPHVNEAAAMICTTVAECATVNSPVPAANEEITESAGFMEGILSSALEEADQLIQGISESILQNLERFTPSGQGSSHSPAAAQPANDSSRQGTSTTQVTQEEDEKSASKAREEAMLKFGHVMDNEFSCSICTELFVHATNLNCSHTFCRWCIFLWKKTKSECPICRQRITTETHSLVLDNFIDKMVDSLSEETKLHRQQLLKERNMKEKEEMRPSGFGGTKRKLLSFHEMLEDTDNSLSDDDDDDDDLDSSFDDLDDADDYFNLGYHGCLTCGAQRGHSGRNCPLTRYR